MIAQVILAFWLGFAYDLLKDKMHDRCILRDWTKDKEQKSVVDASNRYEKKEEERKSRLSLAS